jgi:hypothetical protein
MNLSLLEEVQLLCFIYTALDKGEWLVLCPKPITSNEFEMGWTPELLWIWW